MIPRPIIQWLNGTTEQGHLVIQRLVHLIKKNGGQIGITQVDGVNFTGPEAVELTELSSFLLGMAYISGCKDEVLMLLKQQIEGKKIQIYGEETLRRIPNVVRKSTG